MDVYVCSGCICAAVSQALVANIRIITPWMATRWLHHVIIITLLYSNIFTKASSTSNLPMAYDIYLISMSPEGNEHIMT